MALEFHRFHKPPGSPLKWEKEGDIKYIFQMQTKARVTCQMEFIAMQQHIFSSLVNYRHEVQQILHSIIDLHIITLRQIPWLILNETGR